MARPVLVTGHRGTVGRTTVDHLSGLGLEVRGFDRLEGDDVLDPRALGRAVEGCDAVVHLAALQDPRPGDRDAPAHSAVPGLDAGKAVFAVNAVGTRRVLEACVAEGVRRAVVVSSVNALGVFMGQSPPDYLPIDDMHRARPVSAYGKSKRAAELIAAELSTAGGLTSICLRPAAILDDAMIGALREQRRADPEDEWRIWEYGAWVHVEDVNSAITGALECPPPTGASATVLVTSDDVSSEVLPAREMVRRFAPAVEWRGQDALYETDPWRTLVDCAGAKRLLGWAPRRRWPRRGEVTPGIR